MTISFPLCHQKLQKSLNLVLAVSCDFLLHKLLFKGVFPNSVLYLSLPCQFSPLKESIHRRKSIHLYRPLDIKVDLTFNTIKKKRLAFATNSSFLHSGQLSASTHSGEKCSMAFSTSSTENISLATRQHSHGHQIV